MSSSRRKKNRGNVTILDDDREQLMAKPQGRVDRDGEKTNQQLRAEIIEEAQKGKKETERALRLAVEARDTGKESANQLHQQTEQLERNADTLHAIHDKLDQAEVVIQKIKTPLIKRMFQRKPKQGKGLKNAKATKKERKERQELRNQGVTSLLETDSDEKSNEKEAKNPEKSEYKKKNLLGRKPKDKSKAYEDDNVEEYEEFDDTTRQILKDQDKMLDGISSVVKETSEIAHAINHELEYQSGLIEQTQNDIEETRRRTGKIAAKMTQ